MLLIECMNSDWLWIGLLLTMTALISFIYMGIFLIALKRYIEMSVKTKLAKVYLAKMGVFAFCAVSGYSMYWVGLFMPHYRLMVITMIPLAIVSALMLYWMRKPELLDGIYKQ